MIWFDTMWTLSLEFFFHLNFVYQLVAVLIIYWDILVQNYKSSYSNFWLGKHKYICLVYCNEFLELLSLFHACFTRKILFYRNPILKFFYSQMKIIKMTSLELWMLINFFYLDKFFNMLSPKLIWKFFFNEKRGVSTVY